MNVKADTHIISHPPRVLERAWARERLELKLSSESVASHCQSLITVCNHVLSPVSV